MEKQIKRKDFIKFDDGSGYKDKAMRCLSGDSKKHL